MGIARHAWILTVLAVAACTQEYSLAPADDYEGPPTATPPADFGTWLSMDTTPDGNRIAMTYFDRTSQAIGFAVGTPQADGTIVWAHEQVDGYPDPNSGLQADRGRYGSMRVAPDGTVWAAYYDASARQLRYAHRRGGGPATQSPSSWVTGVVDPSPGVGTWASLDLDAEGKPVIAYHDELGGTLKVAHLAGTDEATNESTWTVVTAVTGQPFSGFDGEGAPISRPADVGEHTRLVIQGGTEFIAYYDRAQQRLGFVESTNGTTYNGGVISPDGANMGQWPSILVDAGTVYVAYHDVENQELRVSSRVAGGWVHELPDESPFVGADTEIFKRNGTIQVVYFDGQNNNVKLAQKTGSVWGAVTLGGDGAPVGFHNEVVRVGETWWAGSYDFSSSQLFLVKLDTPGAN